MASRLPQRGEIWSVDLNPVKGREQAGVRPVFVLSPADESLAIVLPTTMSGNSWSRS